MDPRRRVLLVGWDAADWNVARPLMADGKMPNLSRLVENGASGNIATLYPVLSPMLWTSIATGKRPRLHGIHGFSEPVPGGDGTRPITVLNRKVKAVWNILNQTGRRSVVAGWWPSHPAEPIDGVMISDFYAQAGLDREPSPMLPEAVHPPDWRERLAELRVTPTQLPGEVIRLFVPAYDRVDQGKDRRIHTLGKMIAETMSLHAAATEAIEHSDWDFAAVYYNAVDHFCHGFMGYHPPRLPWISEEDFEIYSKVVEGVYRYQDMMLGRLLALAGPEATVIVMSDHGFHSDARRPAVLPAEPAGPAAEHRHFGILCLSGPGIKDGETIYGSSLLDIVPTILHLFGLPVAEDMSGKVLVTALEDAGKIETVPSWEEIEGPSGQHPPEARLDTVASAEAMRQLVALGYVAPPAADTQKQVDECIAELSYNLARACDDEDRYDISIPIYERMLASDPAENRAAQHLFHALLRIERTADARALLAAFGASADEAARSAADELEKRRAERADEDLASSEEIDARRELHERHRLMERATGHVYLRALLRFILASETGSIGEVRGAYDELEWMCNESGGRVPPTIAARRFSRGGDVALALRFAQQAVEESSDDWQAHSIAAMLHLRAKRYREALDSAAEALALVYFQPRMHFVMGVALSHLGDPDAAGQSLKVAISQAPGFIQAHEALSRLYANAGGDKDAAAARHHVIANRLKRERAAKRGAGRTEAPALAKPAVPRQEFPDRPTDCSPSDCVVVVTGLPRSGTSMLMQVLEAGGVAALTDGARLPDSDNPRGYLEYEPAANLRYDASWLPKARGKAVKLVMPLVPFLPAGEAYRIVVVQRRMREVLASQAAMLSRLERAEGAARIAAQALEQEYCLHERRVVDWLEARPEIGVLPLEYADVLANPAEAARRLATFICLPFDVAAATAAVEPSLRRQSSG